MHTGYFVSWLAASLYPEQFERPENLVLKQGVTGRRVLESAPYLSEVHPGCQKPHTGL